MNDLYSNDRYRFNHALRITMDMGHDTYDKKITHDFEQMMIRMINLYNKTITLFQLMMIAYPKLE